ncbi:MULTISPECIES: DUF222 domain-containing protein [unclassified Mycobacterium]|uniref:DUF222 domain-containing protein n=1 Tax=unclassified Mycobacterium TaxID=2642494 RepID=UPI0029C7E67B|nr:MULTISPECIES: DUF222 domain-containing protein [unclassified Mycobacterium]
MFEQILASITSARSPGDRVRACARLENAACAARLAAMADMLAAAYAADGSAERDQWHLDNWAAVCAQIGAAHQVTSGVASGLLMDAVTLRERLPQVGALFAEGLISYRLVHAICTRTTLVRDPDALRALDAELATELRHRGAMSVCEAERTIDTLVLKHDPHAVRRTQSTSRACSIDVYVEDSTGIAHVSGTVLGTDGKAFDQRLHALAGTVCDRDPRTIDQRRAAALGALGFGWDRLPCLCEQPDCEAASKPAGGGVVIHVIARSDTLDTPAAEGPPPTPESTPQPESTPEREGATPTPPVGNLDAQRRALHGQAPPLLPKPWSAYNWTALVAAINADPGQHCPASPGIILGGAVLPAPIAAQAAMHATLTALAHPGQAPPEPRYRPSKKLAEYVRCRDLTCRFPGCTKPATVADIDHTIPWPYGPTCASNLKCLCREHHLLKTFWPGWHDEQSPDGTVHWTDPDGHTATTHPGSRLLFPELCTPTAEFTTTGTPPAKHTSGLTMPKRKTTRTQDRRQRIDHERKLNAQANE